MEMKLLDTRATSREELLAYCAQDTSAMVGLLEKLEELALESE